MLVFVRVFLTSRAGRGRQEAVPHVLSAQLGWSRVACPMVVFGLAFA